MIFKNRLFHRSILFGLLLSMTACAYMEDTSNQDISVRTPGAVGAVCYLYIDDVKYRMHPPQTINIFRSAEDLIVECLAPGNRQKKKIIPATVSNGAKKNIANLGLGIAWDYYSGALFQYPEIIEVNFIDEPLGDSFIPAHHNDDIRQAEEYPLDSYGPGDTLLNEDANAPNILLRDRHGEIVQSTSQSVSAPAKINNTPIGKGNLTPITNSYGDALDPSQ